MTRIATNSRTLSTDNQPTKKAKGCRQASFPQYMDSEAATKLKDERRGTAKTYLASLKRFADFGRDTSTDIDVLTPGIIEQYQTWLLERGVTYNTVSYYMRTLRAVYTRMVKSGLTTDLKPFARVYTGVAKTRKRAISESDIKKIKSLDLSGNKGLEFVRDIFMLSFYLLGISFVDLALLKKCDLRNHLITYSRAKTGQTISIGVNSKIREILDKYPGAPNSPYLLPIIKKPTKDCHTQYLSALRLANKKLKIIARMAGLDVGLTTYTCRHSWASIAKSKNIEIGIISDALGHQSEATTRIYLANLDRTRVDRANDLILQGL